MLSRWQYHRPVRLQVPTILVPSNSARLFNFVGTHILDFPSLKIPQHSRHHGYCRNRFRHVQYWHLLTLSSWLYSHFFIGDDPGPLRQSASRTPSFVMVFQYVYVSALLFYSSASSRHNGATCQSMFCYNSVLLTAVASISSHPKAVFSIFPMTQPGMDPTCLPSFSSYPLAFHRYLAGNTVSFSKTVHL